MKFIPSPKDGLLLQALQREVTASNKVLEDLIQSHVPLVHQVAAHTLRAGGKRLRPALVFFSAQSTGLDFDLDRVRTLGATLELIHMATLIHDDVIDHAPLRRGIPTANSVFGNTASILSGDVLLAKAMSALAKDGHLDIIRAVSAAVVDLSEGEVQELDKRGIFSLSLEDHLQILHLKTATFIQACCEVGALVAQSPEEVVAALGQYGYNIGMAFQIVDDLLDYRGHKEATGKPLATDFREGCVTLPLLFLRSKLTQEESDVVESKFGTDVSDEEVRMLCGWMNKRGAFSQAECLAEEYIEKAVASLEILVDSPAKDALLAVSTYILSRKA